MTISFIQGAGGRVILVRRSGAWRSMHLQSRVFSMCNCNSGSFVIDQTQCVISFRYQSAQATVSCTVISNNPEFRMVAGFPRSVKSQWKNKKFQGQGIVREFWFGWGKSYFFSQVRKSQGILSSDLCWQCFFARKLWKVFQSYALVWQGQAIYALCFVRSSKHGTCAGSNTCKLILFLEVWDELHMF